MVGWEIENNNLINKDKFKRYALLLALILVVAGIAVSGAREMVTLENLHSFIESIGYWGWLGFILIYSIGASVGFPGTIFTVAGGLIFGKWVGTLLNLIGATIGACFAFAVSRYIAKEAMMEKFGHQKWFTTLNNGLRESGFNYMLFVRLVPIFPFNGLNFAAGLTVVTFRNYLAGTAIGMIPATFVYTNAAAELGDAATEGFHLSGGMVFALLLLGLLAMIPVLIKKYRKTKVES
jgi:uncharacterized membrane protein YdjX (TVP38/TMEM64 family)